jgi:FMN phosphatase YigB (HAD superfamily)
VAVLRGVLQHLAEETSAGRAPVAGFDLDGCLFDTRPRQVHIFRELASQRDLDALYRVGPEHFRDWSLDATMQRAGLDPDWITAHSDEVRRFWFERFFHDDYMTLDHALPGGPGFVRACRDAGALIVYLTGRDIKMRAGTETALRRFGFPYDHDRALLITKPHFDMDDTLFKESALERIATLGNVATYFDNEPANVNLFHARHPEARVVFVETDHSPKPIEPDPDIPWIQSFLLG